MKTILALALLLLSVPAALASSTTVVTLGPMTFDATGIQSAVLSSASLPITVNSVTENGPVFTVITNRPLTMTELAALKSACFAASVTPQ